MSMWPGDKALTWEQRFWRRVEKTDTCWWWIGGSGGYGYGVFNRAGRRQGAHVIAWELANGPMPDGHVIDHLCGNPPCVNPAHLEPVTPQENRRRQSLRKTHCRRGHALVGANLYRHEGKRYCRTCRAAAQRRYLERAS